MKKIVVAIVILLVPVISIAAPTAESAKEVLEHYWSGNSPLLIDYKICSEISKEGENKNDCVTEVDPTAIAKGDKVFLWMNFMVPQNTEQKISVLFTRKNRPEKTREIKITGSLRYRTWTTLPTDKDGVYTVQVDHEVDDNFTTLKSMNYQVSE